MIRIVILFVAASMCSCDLSDSDCIWKAVELLIRDSSYTTATEPTSTTFTYNDDSIHDDKNFISKINIDVRSYGDSINDINTCRITYVQLKDYYEKAVQKCQKQNDFLSTTTTVTTASVPIIPISSASIAPTTLAAYRGKISHIFEFAITGSNSGTVWGTTIYTDDSNLATAAVHSGHVQNYQESTIMVQILPGQSSYTSTSENGITSRGYGAFSGSFSIISATPTIPSVLAPIAPATLTAYRGKINQIFTFAITGSLSGTVWGTGIYTDDSDLATAAAHSGFVQNYQKSTIMVQILPGRSSYNSSTENGITSRGYGAWSGSFSIISATPTVPSEPTTPETLTAYRGKINHIFTFAITGSTTGFVYGTTIYTDNSDIATSAVHSGFVQNNQSSSVTVQLLPGRSSYASSFKNGVTSYSIGAWSGSYAIISATPTIPPMSVPVSAPIAPTTLTAYRNKINKVFKFAVTGSLSGTVWGTSIYTDDSNLAASAVHSGFVQNNVESTIIVQILPGQSNYASSTKNGITSRSYGTHGGSYAIIGATAV